MKSILFIHLIALSIMAAKPTKCPFGKIAGEKEAKIKGVSLKERTPFAPTEGRSLFFSPKLAKAANELDALMNEEQEIQYALNESEKAKEKLKSGWVEKRNVERLQNKILKDSEVAEYEAKLKKLIPLVEKKELEVSKLKEADVQPLIDYKNKREKKDPEWAQSVNDYLNANEIASLDSRRTVTLLLGSHDKAVKINSEESKQIEKLVTTLKNKGFTLLYDADSSYAPLIQEKGGSQAVGITGGSHTKGNTKVIQNPYLRLEALIKGGRVVATPDSTTGNGLLFLGQPLELLDVKDNFGNEFRAWYKEGLKKLGRDYDLGVHYDRLPRSSRASSLIGGLENLKPVTHQKTSNDQPKFKDQSHSQMIETLEHADTMDVGGKMMAGPAGAVYFGSSGHSPSDYKVEEVVRALSAEKIPAITGGAGGSMRIVNREAFQTGVESIGIPIAGRNQLKAESRVGADVQTVTIPVGSYAERIPLLMKDRPIVVFNPGGMGTMRELGTVLVDLAANPKKDQMLLFVGSEYYGPLIKNLKSSKAFPASVLDKMVLVDTGKEAVNEVNQWVQKGRIASKDLYQNSLSPKKITKDSEYNFED